jgi:opacity protein-like surface antigen
MVESGAGREALVLTIRLAAAALAITLLATSSARAQTSTDGVYLTTRLGAFLPKHSDLGPLNAGFDGELGLGYRLARNLGVEGSVGYSIATGGVSRSDPTTGRLAGDTTLSVVPVTATFRALLPLDGIEISALAGAGVYFAHMEVEGSRGYFTPDTALLRTGTWSSSDTPVGVHLGAGFGAHVTPRLLLGADLRYVFASAKLFDTTMHIGGLRLGAVLGYRF